MDAVDWNAPLWLPGGHLQTIWPALRGHGGQEPPCYQRERWDTPDGDFIDVDWQRHGVPQAASAVPRPRPLLVLFPGLEGASDSHYAVAFARYAKAHGMDYAVPHFRGCSGVLNNAPRAYHAGDYAEIDWMVQRLAQRHAGRGALLLVGVSLGANALLRWAEEVGAAAPSAVCALAAVCAPLDLHAAGAALDRGLNRLLYTRRFLNSMKPKALCKWTQYPGLFSRQRLLAARTLYEFDDAFTAPVHGFKDAHDYWTQASAKPQLARIRVASLILHARNDPFIPANSLPDPYSKQHGAAPITFWQPACGGHVGFVQGRPPGHLRMLPEQVGHWLRTHMQ